MQENEQVRASFNAELQKNRRHEEELRELREQQVQNQNKIKSLESWKTVASQLQETSNHTQELLRQVEVKETILKTELLVVASFSLSFEKFLLVYRNFSRPIKI